MSEYREFFICDPRINQTINGFKQEIRLALYQENNPHIEGKGIRVIEKRALDDLQKKYDDLSLLCAALNEAGVDNWGGYSEAMQLLKEWKAKG